MTTQVALPWSCQVVNALRAGVCTLEDLTTAHVVYARRHEVWPQLVQLRYVADDGSADTISDQCRGVILEEGAEEEEGWRVVAWPMHRFFLWNHSRAGPLVDRGNTRAPLPPGCRAYPKMDGSLAVRGSMDVGVGLRAWVYVGGGVGSGYWTAGICTCAHGCAFWESLCTVQLWRVAWLKAPHPTPTPTAAMSCADTVLV